MIDGTKIQIENWNNDYPNIYKKNSTVACYPVAKENIYGVWCYPCRGEAFRFEMKFENEEKAKESYNMLICGKKKLIDYIDNYSGEIRKNDVIRCI